MQQDAAKDLIGISSFNAPIVAVDCCGWHYEKIFRQPITKLELFSTVKSFHLVRDQFDRMIDDRDQIDIVWPKLSLNRPTVLFDRSVILRYKTLGEIKHLLHSMVEAYGPREVMVRGLIQFVDDDRLCDRFYNWSNFAVKGYVIAKFVYDTMGGMYHLHLRQKT